MESMNQPRPALGQAGLFVSSCLVNQRLVAADSSSCVVVRQIFPHAPAGEAGILEPARGIEPRHFAPVMAARLEDVTG